MQPILRRDGRYEMFRVEALIHPERGDEGWIGVCDSFAANVPQKIRYKRKSKESKSSGYYDHAEPFQSFCSSGDCWQTIGIHGSFNRAIAEKYFALIVKYNPKYRFRLVRHVVEQQRTSIMEGQEPDNHVPGSNPE